MYKSLALGSHLGKNMVIRHLAQSLTLPLLVGHRKILTWDKLRRRNYHGPSISVNCNFQEETLHHLLDSCTLSNQLWEKASFRCQRRCRVSNNITDSIRQWHQNPYKSEVLNQLCRLIHVLLTWCIWKERNKRIFKYQITPLEIIGGNFCLNLKETLALRTWMLDDFPTLANENTIWANWNMRLPQGTPTQAPQKESTQRRYLGSPLESTLSSSTLMEHQRATLEKLDMGEFSEIMKARPSLFTLARYDGIPTTRLSWRDYGKGSSFLGNTTFIPWKLKVTP